MTWTAAWIKNALTETDGETYDHIRILAALSVIVGLALQVYVVVRPEKAQPFDMLAFGTGLAAVFGGVGVALKLKPEAK